jgi:hypothetical protein
MKKLVYVLALFCANWASAQITITSADFPQGGDTTITSSTDDLNVDIATTGADTFWDFSSLNVSTQRIDTFYDVSDANAVFQLVFNNGFTNPDYESTYFLPWNDVDFSMADQVGLSIENPILFTKVASDKIETTGFGIVANGIPIPASSDTIDMQYQLPLNYADIWNSNSYTNLDLNPAFDGIFRRYQQRNSVVDGWGQVATPYGTFDALRVRSVIEAQDSVYISFGGFGGQWIELPTPTTIEYTWLANGQKAPVFKVTAQDLGGNETITSVEFKDKKRDFASIQEEGLNLSVYPNPAKGELHVQLEGFSPESVISLIDLQGKIVQSWHLSEVTKNKLLLNAEPGLYHLVVRDQQKELIQKLVIE